jgi:hypothetical protein
MMLPVPQPSGLRRWSKYRATTGRNVVDPGAEEGRRRPAGSNAERDPRSDPPAFHLDLWADDPEAEVQRLLEFGAERVDWELYPDKADFTVLADPEGNRFCVVDASQS